MKNKFFSLLLLLLIMISGSCSKNTDKIDSAEKKYGDWKFLQIKSSAIGGTWHACGSAWANLICSNSEYVAVNSISPGLEFETMQKLKAGKVDIGFAGTSMVDMAYRGGVFWKKPVKGLRALFATQPGILNFITRKNTGINSISDLKGKTIATYSDGNYWGEFVIELLDLHGVNFENSTILRIMKNDSTKMFINREIDAVIHKFGYGHGKLREICKDADIKFLEGDSEIMADFLFKYPSFRLVLFGEENGAENALQLVSNYMTICMDDLPDETAYEITKVWYENKGYLIKLLPTIASYINWDNPAEGVTIPFHDGALKYFKEKGLMSGSF